MENLENLTRKFDYTGKLYQYLENLLKHYTTHTEANRLALERVEDEEERENLESALQYHLGARHALENVLNYLTVVNRDNAQAIN